MFGAAVLGIALWVGMVGNAPAQTPARGDSVLNRFEVADPPPDLHLGSYRISPSAKAEARYDDNIFVDDRAREGDFIFNAGGGRQGATGFRAPRARLLRRHRRQPLPVERFRGLLGGHGRYRGRLDIHRELKLSTDLWARRATDPRDSPDNVNGTEPSVYRLYHGSTTMLAGTTGPLLSRLEVGVDRVNYQPVPSSTGTIDTTERDRDEYYGEGQVGYQYLGPQQIYVRVRGNQRHYVREFDNGGFQRDSTGVRAEAGITMDLGGLVFADLSAGFQRQDFDDARFGTVQRPVFGAALLWNPTGLTSVKAEARYDFIESFNNPSPGFWRTIYGIGVEHELRRDLIALGKLSLTDRDYERLDRSDLLYGVDAGLRYRVDRGLFLEGEYRYRQQDSNAANADYYRNIVFARVRRVF